MRITKKEKKQRFFKCERIRPNPAEKDQVQQSNYLFLQKCVIYDIRLLAQVTHPFSTSLWETIYTFRNEDASHCSNKSQRVASAE